MKEIEQRIIQEASRGSNSAFKTLYDFYAPYVWRLVYRSAGGDREATGEIVQDTFVRVHRSLKKFRKESSISTWIYRIAYNAALAFLKRRKNTALHTIESYDAVPGNERSDRYEMDQLIAKALNGLSAGERFLLTAREVDGMSFEELAIITGKAEGALRTQLSRIKSDIREHFIEKQEFSGSTNENGRAVLQYARSGT